MYRKMDKMQVFNFNETTIFTGKFFYNTYKDSHFLECYSNIESVLSRGHRLLNRMRTLNPGETLVVQGLFINNPRLPLVLKKTGPGIVIQDSEFTMNRLSGLVAAYLFEHRARFPDIDAPLANSLGLAWNNENEDLARLYLSAIYGAEHFIDQFSFFPLICALRRMHLNKMKPEMVVKYAKIKNAEGEKMIRLLQRNMNITMRMWSKFRGSTPRDLTNILGKIIKLDKK